MLTLFRDEQDGREEKAVETGAAAALEKPVQDRWSKERLEPVVGFGPASTDCATFLHKTVTVASHKELRSNLRNC